VRSGRPLSVLHASQPVDGGVARYVADAAADQQARGWAVTVACPPGGALGDELAERGIRTLAWPAARAPGPASTVETLRLGAIASAVRPDVLHLHSSKAGLAGRLALRGRLRTIFQPHGWSWLAAAGPAAAAALRWEQLAARWTDLLVCVGEGEAAEGRARRVVAPYEVVRNGVDLGRYHPADASARAGARRRCGLPGAAPVVVCVGRLTRQKGQDVLHRAWPAVRERHPDAVLVLIGDGDLEPALRRETPAGVRFAGPVADVRDWYAAADLAAVPSRWEGLPLVLLEEMASGLPVVASAVAGVRDVLPPDAGALVPAGDAGGLAGALLRRLADPGLRRREAAAAAREAAGFDLCRTLDLLADLTRRTAATPRLPAPRRGGDRPGGGAEPAAVAIRAPRPGDGR
jgi:glycosyltransferase involved in cell wall biosynthesis